MESTFHHIQETIKQKELGFSLAQVDITTDGCG